MQYYCGKSWVREFLSLFMNIDIKILKLKNLVNQSHIYITYICMIYIIYVCICIYVWYIIYMYDIYVYIYIYVWYILYMHIYLCMYGIYYICMIHMYVWYILYISFIMFQLLCYILEKDNEENTAEKTWQGN